MKKFLTLTLVLILVGSLLSACGNAAGTGNTESSAPIKIGIPCPLSGSSGAIGETLFNAVQLAADQINAKGGIHGRQIVLIKEDDENKSDKAVTVVNKLVYEDKVDAILGNLNSTACLAAQEITNAAGIIQIQWGSNRTITTQGYKYVFRTQANDIYQAGAVVKYAVDELELKKVAVIYVSDDYGTGGKDVAIEELAKRGLDPVAVEAFEPEAQDLTSQLTSIKNANADAVIMWCMYQPGALICTQMAQMGMKDIPKFGGGGLVNKQLFELAQNDAVGVSMTQLFFPDAEAANDVGKQFLLDYVAKFGSSPDNNSGMAFDSMHILAAAMNNAPETLTSDEVASELLKLSWHGVSGDITFSPEGDALRELTIVRIGEGGIYEIAYNPNV